jgi:CopG family nickel-responsive transcriptional regulator
MTTRKKRFGVSVPSGIADGLDEVKEISGSDRSFIVSKALEEYLHGELHKPLEHKCSGLIIVYGDLQGLKIDANYRGLVKGVCSICLSSGVVTVLFVEGCFRDIQQLRRILARRVKAYYGSRYIPLYCSLGEGRYGSR